MPSRSNGPEPRVTEGNDSGSQAPEKPSPAAAVVLRDDQAQLCYANFCRVTGTPEELILDFGLNSQPYGVPTEPVDVKQRLVVNYFTAKRMLQALAVSIQRHEQAFGVLETDVQKRVVSAPSRSPAGG